MFFFLISFSRSLFSYIPILQRSLTKWKSLGRLETPMFLFVTESWLSSQIHDPAVAIPGYNLFRKDCTTLTFFLNKVLVLVRFFFLSLFQDSCCLTYQYYSNNYQSGGAAEGRRLQQHPYFYALRSHGFRVKSTILPSQFLATIFSGRIAPLEQAVEYVFLF